MRKHSSEELVKKVFAYQTGSKDRKDGIEALRRKGNFILFNEKGVINPVQRPSKQTVDDQKVVTDDFTVQAVMEFIKKKV